MKVDIVVTTIFAPHWLQGYLDNILQHGRKQDVTLRIVTDRKTPQDVYVTAAKAAADGFKIDCPTLDEQIGYLNHLRLSDAFIPWNTDNRRNIGFLRAWENGADVLISIDDDNYCVPDTDFVGEHLAVGQPLSAINGYRYAGGAAWFNICSLLKSQLQDPIFARGYPYSARKPEAQAVIPAVPPEAKEQPVAINAGLWLGDPDVDAISRLAQAPNVTSASGQSVVLGPKTWTPINTQNTALMRSAIPAYYYVRMGYPLGGMTIDRFGDILSGYFVQKCAKHLGHLIRLGSPAAVHRRTPHNLFKDLYHELAGIALVEDLLPWLQEVRLDGDDYASAYASLADRLEEQAPRFSGFIWDQGGCEFLQDTARHMRTWLDTLARLT